MFPPGKKRGSFVSRRFSAVGQKRKETATLYRLGCYIVAVRVGGQGGRQASLLAPAFPTSLLFPIPKGRKLCLGRPGREKREGLP